MLKAIKLFLHCLIFKVHRSLQNLSAHQWVFIIPYSIPFVKNFFHFFSRSDSFSQNSLSIISHQILNVKNFFSEDFSKHYFVLLKFFHLPSFVPAVSRQLSYITIVCTECQLFFTFFAKNLSLRFFNPFPREKETSGFRTDTRKHRGSLYIRLCNALTAPYSPAHRCRRFHSGKRLLPSCIWEDRMPYRHRRAYPLQ